MQICPSVLEYQAEDYFTIIKKLLPFYTYFQIDFADGVYVDNKTASFDDFIEELTSGNFKNLITLQTLKTLYFDFHFMVKDYEKNIKKLQAIKDLINIKNVFIHYNLFPKYLILNTRYSFPIGLVLSPQDQVSDLATRYTLHVIPCIQIMSIIPGAQGKPFIPETLNKIEQLRSLGYRNNIFLDGAVNGSTIEEINSRKYLPDFICPGSYLAKASVEELKKRVDYLLKFT
jgi:pentose-5-phosphate-3-epimerase